MRALLWILRGIVFIALLGLAIKNSGEVELRFYFDAHWQVPLSLLLLAALLLGVALGMLALLPRLARLRHAATIPSVAKPEAMSEPPTPIVSDV